VLNDATVVVAFENDVWLPGKFAASNIRKPPKLSAAELAEFSPRINEEVELRVNGTEHAPPCWGIALVRNIKHTFYFVSLVSAEDSNAIVEKDQLRPKTVSTGLPGGLLKQELYKLPSELEAWIGTVDAAECFEHIEEQSGLIFIQTLRSELRLIGDAKTIQRAKMLLQLHIKHQGKIQSFQETLEKQMNALEKKRNRIEGTGYKHSIEFQVDAGSIPRIIGKGGEAIRSLQDKYEVNISILPQEGEDGRRMVRIFGNNTDSIEKARADVEYVEVAMTVEPKMKSWILGKGGKTIQSFKESANLLYAHLDSEGEQLWLKGTRRSVHDAKAMFETHFMYYNVFLQMDDEMDQILNELQEYGDTNARWEWGWYRDEDDEYPKGGLEWKGSKGGGKGAKSGGKGGKGGGGRKGKDWEEPLVGSSGKKGKDLWEEESPVSSGKRGKEWDESPAAGGKRGKEWEESPAASAKRGKEWEQAPAASAKKGKDSEEPLAGGGRRGKDLEEPSAASKRKGKELEEPPPVSPARGKGGKGGKGASKAGDWQRKEQDHGVEEEDNHAAKETASPARSSAAGARNSRATASAGGATPGGRAAAAAAAGPERESPSGAPSGRRMGKKGLRS